MDNLYVADASIIPRIPLANTNLTSMLIGMKIASGAGGLGVPTVTSEEQARLLGPVLKDTSRAFYLTLRVLPGNVRSSVGLAYLLARTADTIADTKTASATDRLTALLTFRRQVDGSVNKEEVEELVRSAGTGIRGAEGELIQAMPKSLSMLDTLSDMDRFRVRQVVTTLTQGMELDLTHFPEAQLTAFENSKQLDEYTYLVAGCVGQFWTEISIAHFPGLKGWNAEAMSGNRGSGSGRLYS